MKQKNEKVIAIFHDEFLQHHGIIGQKWGTRNGPPYPLNSIKPYNLVSRDDMSKLAKYKMNIIGEIHNRNMIDYYDKLLAKKKPEYFICEFADMDRCYNRKQLKDRMDHATDGSYESDGKGADYQYNYWAYQLAYKHNCKLIGCNPVYNRKSNKMNDEDAFREKYMLKVLKEFEGKNAVVQLGDHHLRSIPISKEFLDFTNTKEDDRGVVTDLTVKNPSPVWEYFKNKPDVSISREPGEYKEELSFQKQAKHVVSDGEFLSHHGIKGQKWGVKNGPPYPLTRVTKGSPKSTNEIYSKLSTKEKHLVADTKTKPHKQFIKPEEEKYLLAQILTKYGDTPVSALDIWNQGNGEASVSIMTDPNYRGKGLAGKAVKEALRWYDKNQNVRKLTWGVKSENTASRKLAEKYGFEMIPGSTEKWDDWVVYAKSKDTPVSKLSVYD